VSEVFHYSRSQFAVRVPKGGYRWVEVEHKDKKLLKLERNSPKPIEKEGYRHYQPLAKPELFRRFAQLGASSPEKALRFANRYGELGIKEFQWDLSDWEHSGVVNAFWKPLFDTVPPNDLFRPSDTWDLWKTAIEDIRLCLEMWDLIASGSRADLRKLRDRIRRRRMADVVEKVNIRLEGYDVENMNYFYYDDGTGKAPLDMPSIASDFNDGLFLKYTEEITPKALALYHIHNVANRYLRRFTRVEFEPASAKLDNLAFVIAPSSLIGALWIQFAQHISGVPDGDYRACKCGCGRVFKPTKSNQVFWQDDCRTRHNRRLRRERDAERLTHLSLILTNSDKPK